MRETILEILRETNRSIDYQNETALIDDKLIDSLDLMEIISDLESAFQIEIGMEEIVPANFNSVEAMEKMVSALISKKMS